MAAPYDLRNFRMPDAIYLDTNALRQAGIFLDSTWITESRAEASKYSVPLAAPRVCVDEFAKFVAKTMDESFQQAVRHISSLNRLLSSEIPSPSVSRKSFKQDATKLVCAQLESAGIQTIPNHFPDTDVLLQQALDEIPPFEAGDKGFRDTIAVESIRSHARSLRSDPIVWIVTSDKVFSRCLPRFQSDSIRSIILKPDELATNINTCALVLGAAVRIYRDEHLLEFTQTQEEAVRYAISHMDMNISSTTLFGFDHPRPTLLGVHSVALKSIDNIHSGIPLRKIQLSEERIGFYMDITLSITAEVKRTRGGFLFSGLLDPGVTATPAELTQSGPKRVSQMSYAPYEEEVLVETIEIKKSLEASVIAAPDSAENKFVDLQIHAIGFSRAT